MFTHQLFISHLPPSSLIFIFSPSSLPTSKLSGCCLLGSEAEWGDLALFPLLASAISFLLKHMFMHQICALCVSPRQGARLSPGLMRPGSPLCTCLEEEGGTAEETEEVGERAEGNLKWRGDDFLIFYTGFVVLEGSSYVCESVFFESIGENKRWGYCGIHCLRVMLSLYI